MTATPRPAARPRADLRTLSAVQLQQLAARGSRSARAELERRMGGPVPPPAQPAATPSSAAAAPLPQPAAAKQQPAHQALIEQWELIERQQSAQARSAGAPRLVGWVLVGWGVLLGLGGLVLLTRRGGAYYLLCGLGCAAVGALLARRSRWAMLAHALLAALALAWAWSHGANAALALVQAAPVLLAALWMAAPGVREGLD